MSPEPPLKAVEKTETPEETEAAEETEVTAEEAETMTKGTEITTKAKRKWTTSSQLGQEINKNSSD